MEPSPRKKVVARESVGFVLVCSMRSNSSEVVEMVVAAVQFLSVVVEARLGVHGETMRLPSFSASAYRGAVDRVLHKQVDVQARTLMYGRRIAGDGFDGTVWRGFDLGKMKMKKETAVQQNPNVVTTLDVAKCMKMKMNVAVVTEFLDVVELGTVALVAVVGDVEIVLMVEESSSKLIIDDVVELPSVVRVTLRLRCIETY